MMDYYSDQPQPSNTGEILFNTAKNWNICKNIPEDDLKKLIDDVIKDSKEYSLAGYMVFGKKENEDKLRCKISIHLSSLVKLK